MKEQPTCEERIGSELQSTLDTLRDLWKSYCEGEEYCEEHNTNMSEYHLGFDYVAPDTFKDQDEGYFRYQLSWGGPSDEFRFFVTPGRHGYEPYRIEYWFLDWWDGASRRLHGEDRNLLNEIFTWFDDMGCVESAIEEIT